MKPRFTHRMGCLVFFASAWCSFAQEPEIPTTSVQIVNATSVPNIALKVNGQSSYPEFAQGLYTADAPVDFLTAVYSSKFQDLEVKSEEFVFSPRTHQSIVILGDFSTRTPPGALPQPAQPLSVPDKSYPPNILFLHFPHELESQEKSLRLTVVNGIPGKVLSFSDGASSREINPGENVKVYGQSPIATYIAKVDELEIPVLMRQEGLLRNALVVFYLKDGKPSFMRAFENSEASNRTRDRMQAGLDKAEEATEP